MKELLPGKELWVCPGCAFTFDAFHEDGKGGYSCPNCFEEKARKLLKKFLLEREYPGRDPITVQDILEASELLSE